MNDEKKLIVLITGGQISMRMQRYIDAVKGVYPSAEFVTEAEAKERGMLPGLQGDKFECLGFDECAPLPTQFSSCVDGVSRTGKGERKRNRADRWR
jgi:hypothetical protein